MLCVIKTNMFYYLLLFLVECSVISSHRNLDNGKVKEKTYYYKQKLVIECDQGYISKDEVECLIDGTWSKEAKCVASGGLLDLV